MITDTHFLRLARRGLHPDASGGEQRCGFTLIELLITILVIGVLGLIAYGALQQATGVSKIVHTKSTIAKLNASLMDRWDSYRSRRLPVDPKTILLSPTSQGGNARAFCQALWVQRGSQANDSLGLAPGNAGFPSNLQVAATRLACMRELLQYEMPCVYTDLIGNYLPAGSPTAFTLRQPSYLGTVPPIAQTYYAQVMTAAANGTTWAQIDANQSAECLYMVLTLSSTDSGLFGEQMPTADVGDVDGDGMPEFQDAWPVAINSYTPKGQANAPINYLRWAPGYISALQPDPEPIKVGQIITPPAPPHPATAAEALAASIAFCNSHHDYFDPLKLDTRTVKSTNARGFQLTPLIYSAGPDGVWSMLFFKPMVDPYALTTGQMQGTPDPTTGGADLDNVTNHELTRSGK